MQSELRRQWRLSGVLRSNDSNVPQYFLDFEPQVKPEEVELVRRDYAANGGWETFLSYEDVRQDILVGLLRLRRCFGPGAGPANERQPGLRGRVSVVRELHVYGAVVAVHARNASKAPAPGPPVILTNKVTKPRPETDV